MNEIIASYISVTKDATRFTGRSGRREYWMFLLINVGIAILLGVVDSVVGFPILGLLFSLAVLLPGLAVSIRRLHDTDRSGWWLLVGLVPVVGGLALLVLMFLEGTLGENRYGAATRQTTLA